MYMINKEYLDLFITKVDKNNFEIFKSLQESIFPKFYTDKFYNELMTNKNCKGYIIKENKCDVGIMSYKIIPEGVYIMTFGVLTEFKRQNIGKTALKTLEVFILYFYDIKSIYLHVSVMNQPALSFYKNNGYETLAYKQYYYKNIEQRRTYLLNKTL
ncbi:hypothetical protein BDAP_000401 [Binucleata daphniae]